MSIVSELNRRAGFRAPTRAGPSTTSSSGADRETVRLARVADDGIDALAVARALVRAGVGPRLAKKNCRRPDRMRCIDSAHGSRPDGVGGLARSRCRRLACAEQRNRCAVGQGANRPVAARLRPALRPFLHDSPELGTEPKPAGRCSARPAADHRRRPGPGRRAPRQGAFLNEARAGSEPSRATTPRNLWRGRPVVPTSPERYFRMRT